MKADLIDEPTHDSARLGPLPVGARVEVRKRFDASWARGFEVAAVSDGGYRLRRLSDNSELPTLFSDEDVRPEKDRKRSMWWY